MTQKKASYVDDPLYELFLKAFERHLYSPLFSLGQFVSIPFTRKDVHLKKDVLEKIFRLCYGNGLPPDPELIKVLLQALEINVVHLSEKLKRHILDSFKAAVLDVRASHKSDVWKGPIEAGPSEAKTSPNLDIKSGDQEKKFTPQKYGGKELCIVVSYSKAGKHNLKELAKILTHKAKIEYKEYGLALNWHKKNYASFKNHVSKLRKKARDEGWWDKIPKEYHRSYL